MREGRHRPTGRNLDVLMRQGRLSQPCRGVGDAAQRNDGNALVGSDEKIDWAQADAAVTIQPPKTKLFDEATVFKVTLKE